MAAATLVPVCANCKRPLVRSSEEFWVCSSPGACRGLILAGQVVDAERAARRERQNASGSDRNKPDEAWTPFEV